MRLLKVFKTKNPSIMEDYINNIDEKIRVLEIQYSSSLERTSWKHEGLETLYVAFITYMPQVFHDHYLKTEGDMTECKWQLIKWIDIDGITHYPLKEELPPHD